MHFLPIILLKGASLHVYKYFTSYSAKKQAQNCQEKNQIKYFYLLICLLAYGLDKKHLLIFKLHQVSCKLYFSSLHRKLLLLSFARGRFRIEIVFAQCFTKLMLCNELYTMRNHQFFLFLVRQKLCLVLSKQEIQGVCLHGVSDIVNTLKFYAMLQNSEVYKIGIILF